MCDAKLNEDVVTCAVPVFRLRGDADPHQLLEDPVVADISKKHRHSSAQVSASACTVSRLCVCIPLSVTAVLSQVLLRYHVQQGIAVIPKSDKPHHILENTKVHTLNAGRDVMCSAGSSYNPQTSLLHKPSKDCLGHRIVYDFLHLKTVSSEVSV